MDEQGHLLKLESILANEHHPARRMFWLAAIKPIIKHLHRSLLSFNLVTARWIFATHTYTSIYTYTHTHMSAVNLKRPLKHKS